MKRKEIKKLQDAKCKLIRKILDLKEKEIKKNTKHQS